MSLVNLTDTLTVKSGSVTVNEIRKGSERFWPIASDFYLELPDGLYHVTGIDGTQYIKEKVAQNYALCGISGKSEQYETGIKPGDYTEFVVWFTKMQSQGDRSIYNKHNDKSNGISLFTASGSLYFDYGAVNNSGENNSNTAARINFSPTYSLVQNQFDRIFVVKCGRSETFNNSKKYLILTDTENSFTNQSLNGYNYGMYKAPDDSNFTIKIGSTKASTDFRFYRIQIFNSGVLEGDIYWDVNSETPILVNDVTGQQLPVTYLSGNTPSVVHYTNHSISISNSVTKDFFIIDGTITDGNKIYDRLVNKKDNSIIWKGAEVAS